MVFHLEELTHSNFQNAQEIQRDDIPKSWVDSVETLMEITDYGVEHKCIGHTFLVKSNGRCIGILLLGEAIPWDTDPVEMKNEPFYRLMGFVIDKSYRSKGFGGEILEMAINEVYQDFGKRPIALGCHKENTRAAVFYEKHGFKRTGVFEGNDEYFLRMI
jgi:RimJ/RimL family protein N-acetyltransferase